MRLENLIMSPEKVAARRGPRNSLTAERLRHVLRYNPDTGVFLWVVPPWNHPRMLGKEAGSPRGGYNLIRVDGHKYGAHRLAWLYMVGDWPEHQIDHKDGNPANNKWSNLRSATRSQNLANSGLRRGKTLPRGVRLNHGAFTARINDGSKLVTIGTFPTVEQAESAYREAAIRVYGEFARLS